MYELCELQTLLCETFSVLHIKPQLRALKVDLDQNKKLLSFWLYHDGEIYSDDACRMNTCIDYVVKNTVFDFQPPYLVNKHILRWDYPRKIPDEGHYVYLRDETIFTNSQTVQPLNISPDIYYNRDRNDYSYFDLIVLYSLLGKIRPNLRSMHIFYNEIKSTCYFWFYFDGEIADVDRKIARGIADNIVSAAGFTHLEIAIDRIDYPQKLPSIGHNYYQKDESDYDEEKTLREKFKEKKLWRDLATNQLVQYSHRVPSLNNFFDCIRSALLREITSHLRAIQFEADQIKGKIYLWFYFEKEISEEDLKRVNSIIKKTSDCKYSIEKYIERLDFPAKIPSRGQYIFLRDESVTPISPKNNENIKDSYLPSFISTTAFGPNLRAITMTTNTIEKKIYCLFFFHGDIADSDAIKAEEVVQKIKQQFPDDFSEEGYVARYDFPEKLPAIGKTLYLRKGEINLDEVGVQEEDFEQYFFRIVLEALAGKIKPHLRAVKGGVDEFRKIFYLLFFFDGELSDADRQTAIEISKCTNKWPEFTCKTEIERLDYPQTPPFFGRFIYFRQELL